jgi:hypothetical protein
MFLTAGSRAGRKRRIGTGRIAGYAITDAAGFAINPGNGPVQWVSLGAARTPVFAGWVDGDSVLLLVQSNGFALDYSALGVLWEGGSPIRLSPAGVTAVLFERYAGVTIASAPNPTANEILYVGGNSTSGSTSGSTTTPSISLTALLGGIDSAARAGDIVIVGLAAAGAVNLDLAMNTSGYAEKLDIYADGTALDANLGIYTKFMGSTPDATAVGSIPSNPSGAYTMTVHVFRGVDSDTPLDTAPLSATGTGESRPNPPSIAAASSNGLVMIFGANANQYSYGAMANPSPGLSGFLTPNGGGSYGMTSAAGFIKSPLAAIDIAAMGSDDPDGAWCAASLVLRRA